MGVELLTERHASQIAGVLGCYDRMLIFGTLPGICYAGGMTSFLYARQIRIFDYPKFAEPFRERIRENAERMAAASGIKIEFIRTRSIRKEDRAPELLAKRGEHPGLVCIFSAMEACSTYKPWHNKQNAKTYLVPNDGKCLHYYFYFVDEELGFCHVRVPTWLPCCLQICLNRAQYHIEDAFKQMKNPHFLGWSPMFHWTGSKIQVHAFYCVLSLLLTSLLQRELACKGESLSINRMVEELDGIRKTLIVYPRRQGQRKAPTATCLTRMNGPQLRLFSLLDLRRFFPLGHTPHSLQVILLTRLIQDLARNL